MLDPQIESLVSVCHNMPGNVQRARRQTDGAALVCGRNDRGGKQFRRVNGPAAILISDSPLGSKTRTSSGPATGRERSASAHNHPGPDNETNWLPAPTVRTITAYQRVGWLAKKAKPVKARPIPRKTLEPRLQKLESEAAQLRQRLDNLPSDE